MTEHSATAAVITAGVEGCAELVKTLRQSPDAHVLSKVLCALALRPELYPAAESLATDPVPNILKRHPTTVLLAMPTTVAARVPLSSLPDSEVLISMLTQGHRFVTVHSTISMTWMESFLGYLTLLVRADGLSVTAVRRIRSGTGHNTVIRGMLIGQAQEERPTLSVELQTKLVLAVAALANGVPCNCVIGAVAWLGAKTERTRVAMAPSMRPIVQMFMSAISTEALALSDATSLMTVLRFLVTSATAIPAAMDWLMAPTSTPERWTPDAVACILDHPALVDEFVYAHMFRPGVAGLLIHSIVQDPRYLRRGWQPILRLHARVTGDRPAVPRGACPLWRVVASAVHPPTPREVADAASLLVTGTSTLTWRWWSVSRVDDDTLECNTSSTEVRTWALERLRKYLEGQCWVPTPDGPLASYETDNALVSRLRVVTLGDGALRGEMAWVMLQCSSMWAVDELCRSMLERLESIDVTRLSSVFPRLRAIATESATAAAVSVCLHALIENAPPPPSEMLSVAHLGAVVQGLPQTTGWLLLRRSAELGLHTMWAALVRCCPDCMASWVTCTLVLQDKLGCVGRMIASLAASESTVEHPVLVSLSTVLQAVISGSPRVRDGDNGSDNEDETMMPVSDLQGPMRDLANLFARHYGAAAQLWPVLGVVHHSHLAEIPPETVNTLLEQVETEDDDCHIVCFCAFLAEWILGFGPSVAMVWPRYLASERLDRVLTRCAQIAPDTHLHITVCVNRCCGQ